MFYQTHLTLQKTVHLVCHCLILKVCDRNGKAVLRASDSHASQSNVSVGAGAEESGS